MTARQAFPLALLGIAFACLAAGGIVWSKGVQATDDGCVDSDCRARDLRAAELQGMGQGFFWGGLGITLLATIVFLLDRQRAAD